jgi:hypothetical protein
MANCGLLKNDGASFFLLNAGGVLLLNDNSCGTEAGVSASALAATGAGTGSFTGAFDSADAVVTPPTGAGWADQYKARQRQERWDEDNRRMELLERKKTRISMEIGLLRDELRSANHPRMAQRIEGKLDDAMSSMMAIEDELQQLYSRMSE